MSDPADPSPNKPRPIQNPLGIVVGIFVLLVVLLGAAAALILPGIRVLAERGESAVKVLKAKAAPTPRRVAKREAATPRRIEPSAYPSGLATPRPTHAPSQLRVAARPAAPFTNGLGMKFVPVSQADGRVIFFSVWETRRRDYEAFAAAMPNGNERWKTAEWFGQPSGRGELEPVVFVTWLDAQAFCQWLTRTERAAGRIQPGESYRLPTDLEWSRAIGLEPETGATPEERSGKVLAIYPWGTRMPPPPRAGNFGDETARLARTRLTGLLAGGYDDGFATTAPVGSFAPGAFGLHDMAGNVWEMCEDWLGDPRRPDPHRVTRGGAFNEAGLKLLSSARSGVRPGQPHGHVGFRVVLAPGR